MSHPAPAPAGRPRHGRTARSRRPPGSARGRAPGAAGRRWPVSAPGHAPHPNGLVLGDAAARDVREVPVVLRDFAVIPRNRELSVFACGFVIPSSSSYAVMTFMGGSRFAVALPGRTPVTSRSRSRLRVRTPGIGPRPAGRHPAGTRRLPCSGRCRSG